MHSIIITEDTAGSYQSAIINLSEYSGKLRWYWRPRNVEGTISTFNLEHSAVSPVSWSTLQSITAASSSGDTFLTWSPKLRLNYTVDADSSIDGTLELLVYAAVDWNNPICSDEDLQTIDPEVLDVDRGDAYDATDQRQEATDYVQGKLASMGLEPQYVFCDGNTDQQRIPYMTRLASLMSLAFLYDGKIKKADDAAMVKADRYRAQFEAEWEPAMAARRFWYDLDGDGILDAGTDDSVRPEGWLTW